MGRELIACLAGVALFAVPGLALTSFFPALRSVPWTRRPGYGYLLGVAAVAGSLYAMSAVLDVPLRRPAILGTAAALTIAGLVKMWLTRTDRAEHRPLPRRARAIVLAAALAGAGVSAGLLADAVSEPLLGWDGRMQWAAQARYIRFEGSVLPIAMTRGQWFINHPRYPVLLPVAQVAVLEVTGAGEDDVFFRGVYAAFLPALLLVVYDGARRWAGWLPAAVTATAAAGLHFLTFYMDGGAISGYSDFPLACFYGAAVVLLLRSQVTAADGVAAGLLLGAACLTKNEGTILAGFALLAGALPLLPRFRRRREAPPVPRRRLLLKGSRLAAAAALLLTALALFVHWRTIIPNRHDEGYSELVREESLWPDAVVRLPDLAGEVLFRTFLTWEHWTGFWWVYVVVLVAGWRVFAGRRGALSRPLALAALGPLAVAWGAYSVHWQPVELIKVTWERFLVQASIPALLLFALALGAVLKRALPGLAGRLARSGHSEKP